MIHDLNGPSTNGDTIFVGCTCGQWTRMWHERMAPGLQEMESDHEAHRQHAGARDLHQDPHHVQAQFLQETASPVSPSFENLLREMAKFVQASVEVVEQMNEFLTAHEKGQKAGIGVVVVRQANGSLTSTPNVFLPAGTSIFIDDPAGPPIAPQIKFEPEVRQTIEYRLPLDRPRTIDTGIAA